MFYNPFKIFKPTHHQFSATPELLKMINDAIMNDPNLSKYANPDAHELERAQQDLARSRSSEGTNFDGAGRFQCIIGFIETFILGMNHKMVKIMKTLIEVTSINSVLIQKTTSSGLA